MDAILGYLRHAPTATLFLCLAAGYLLGRLRVGQIELGGVCGTLVVALLIGQIGVRVDDGVKEVAFALFIFALGFGAGPQFFANLTIGSWRVALLAFIEVTLAVGLVLGATWLLQLDRGTAGGLLAGAATESAVVGTAGEALARLDLSPDDVNRLQANVATTYSITYLFGLVTIVLFTTQLAPRLLRVNLQEEAAALWARLEGDEGPQPGHTAALPDLVGRLYRIPPRHTHDSHDSRDPDDTRPRTVADIEDASGGGLTVERVRRGTRLLEPTPGLRLHTGDRVLIVGRRDAMVAAAPSLGHEIPAEEGLDLPMESRQIYLNRREVDRLTIADLRARADASVRHGVYIQRVTRGSRAMPALAHTMLHQGDVITLYGAPHDLDRATKALGFKVTPSDKTDLVLLGAGIVCGTLIGGVTIPVGGIPVSLGTGGGCLIAGLLAGWWRARRATGGTLPPAAVTLLKDFGLAAFIAVLGLSAGAHALELITRYGIALPVTGILVSFVPALTSLLVGRYLLHLDVPILLGGIAGQQASTPAISAIVTSAGNSTPLLGYTVTYALANVLLPLAGPLVVNLAGLIAP